MLLKCNHKIEGSMILSLGLIVIKSYKIVLLYYIQTVIGFGFEF